MRAGLLGVELVVSAVVFRRFMRLRRFILGRRTLRAIAIGARTRAPQILSPETCS